MNKIPVVYNEDCDKETCDKHDYDEMLQIIVEINKLIATYQDDEKHTRFYDKHQESFEQLKASLESISVILPTIFNLFAKYDYGNVRANGYRSYFNIVRCSMIQLKRQINNHMTCFLINRQKYEYYVFDNCECFNQLVIVAKYLTQMMIINSDNHNLFLSKENNEDLYIKIMECYETMNCDVFYGQSLGFYLCDSCQIMAKVLCSIQLGMGQAMILPRSDLEMVVSTVLNGAQSLIHEHKRASNMTHLYRQATVTFCKQFWNLVDNPILIRWAKFVLPSIAVIREITLQPVGLEFAQVSDKDSVIKISPPVAHSGYAEVKVRLLSNVFRKGMSWVSVNNTNTTGTTNKTIAPNNPPQMDTDDYAKPSEFLLFHCHGGGFVAQSSQSHDSYVRQWTLQLDCPIVSVDYSHAPEYPFPRAHEECFYAYCWCLKNLSEIGCSSDCKVIICGDSAGGNLALGVVLKALQLNIQPPHGVVLAYPATLIDFIPSPARMLGILDPILPIGVLARCLLAYGGANEDYITEQFAARSSDSPNGNDQKLSSMSSKKKVQCFVESDAYDSSGAKMFQSSIKSLSPITLLENASIPNDPIMSPLIADENLLAQFPPMTIFASEFDPLLDDSVEFCKKVSKAYNNSNEKKNAMPCNERYRLNVMPKLPHGFLSMASPVTKECQIASQLFLDEFKQMMQLINGITKSLDVNND